MLIIQNPLYVCSTPAEKKASDILREEIASRIGTDSEKNISCSVIFTENEAFGEDDFSIGISEREIRLSARGIRGFIFAVGMLLRKTEAKNNALYPVCDFSGFYSPDKKIRGHQVGYRPTPNTYDAWDIPEYRRYYLDMMYFGVNTCEHIPYENGRTNRNEIMKRDEQELLCEASAAAKEYGMSVSLWYPNCEKDIETAKENREKLFSEARDLDYIFPPGGDPGNLQPEEFVLRCEEFDKILKKYHPTATMWPSAQQPHHLPDWGIRFLKEMKKNPSFIEGVVTGPNAAFPIDVLRRHLPSQYPIRLYPDITHNLRCEYPVHSDRDDWHYALQTVNGRECANPRPYEYKRIHEETRNYVIGSVSYSEGVNDDINKAVWSALDFDPDTPLREILEDYSRLFFPGSNYTKVADAIFGLEKNWEGAPEDNPQIDYTLKLWKKIGEENPALYENWRFRQCLFRARCDAFVRIKILHENKLIAAASRLVKNGRVQEAYNVLSDNHNEETALLRQLIDEDADKLFSLIGLQLSTKKHFAMNFERGAVLDTIDLALTDLPWLLSRFDTAENMSADSKTAYLKKCFERNRVERGELYYSVALHGLCPGGVKQNKGFYMNIQGDRPDKNKGNLPTSLFKFYDHFSFRLKTCIQGCTDGCTLMITHRDLNNEDSINHTVKVNGRIVYRGQQFGGRRNTDYETDMLPDGFIAIEYHIPQELIINGCIDLQITEPVNGFEIAELRITKEPYRSGIWRENI